MKMLSFLLLAVSLTACTAANNPPREVTAPASSTSASVQPLEYRLDTGDKVNIKVFGEDNLSGDFQIDGNGIISFPLIGIIEAKGLTARELEGKLRDTLTTGYLKDPRVSVEVLTYRPFYILGEVKTPGSYPYVTGMTIENAVALAGGYTYRGRKDEAIIKRGGQSGAEATVETTAPVFPGDVVTIKERYF